MKKRAKNTESGQAIILIVFSIVGLIGMTALTVDGGMAYSDRRHAQNAADTAALAGARATVRDEDMETAALNLASLNGYDDTDATSASSSTMVNVEVYSCVDPASSCGSTYEGNEDYVQVLITSTINTFFGNIVGVSQLTNRVNSIAHAEPGAPDPTNFGNAMESFMPGCQGDDGWNKDPFKITGNGGTVVMGSGVKVNSTCDNYALVQSGSSTITAPSVCVGGTSNTSGGVIPAPDDDCGSPSPARQWPTISCDNNPKNGMKDAAEMGQITEVAGLVYTSTPGYYSGDFPTGASGWLLMQSGIYCIEGGDFSVASTLSVKSDVNLNGTHDYQSEGVLIYLTTGGVTLNGSSEFKLHAISDPNQDQFIQNLLFYLPPGNTSPVRITGNSSSEFTGSIWAPTSHVALEGNGGTTVNSQVLGYSIEVAGGAGLTINYDEDQNAVSMSPASINLSK